MLSKRFVLYLCLFLAGLLIVNWFAARAAVAVITLNPLITYQTMSGWEAGISSTVLDYKPYLPAYDKVFELAANDLGINRVLIGVHAGIEHPPGYAALYLNGSISEGQLLRQAYDIINDNADPFVADPNAFEFGLLDWRMENIILPYKARLEARGEKLYSYLSYVDFEESPFEHYQNPEEYAEFMQVLFDHLKSKYGFVPDGINIMNEPDNTLEWTPARMGQVIARTGPRLAAAGYHPDFIGPSTVDRGHAVAYFDGLAAIPGVRQYMKYLSFHIYADTGTNTLQNIAARATENGMQTLMNEAGVTYYDYQSLHQDLKLANMSAWQQGSFHDQSGFYAIDPTTFQVTLREKTKFLRQYYKYIRSGAKRIEATTTNSALDPVAFINSDGAYVTVIKADTTGDFSVQNLPAGTYGVFYTTGSKFDVQSPDVVVGSGQALSATIPEAGVITIYRKWPSSTPFTIASSGNVSLTTLGSQRPLQVGYARIEGAPAGIALFGFRSGDALVSEAGVPAVRPISAGRIYAEDAAVVRTGLAVANPNSQDVVVSYYFTDARGQNFGEGSTTIQANRQIAAFLDEQPYFTAGQSSQPVSAASSFTFSSSLPVASIALRQFVNERGESLMTTLPIADLSRPVSSDTVLMPHFAEGGGWTTQVILVNPTDDDLRGSLHYFDPMGGSLSTQSYIIPGRSAVSIRRSSPQTEILTGSIQVVADQGSSAPVGLSVLSYRPGGITVTQTGVPTINPASSLDIYVETAVGLRSSFAFANPQAQPITIGFSVLGSDGQSLGINGALTLPANGQLPRFVDELPGAQSLPATFRGTVRVTAPAGLKVAAIGLRTRTNERKEFLISSTMPHQDTGSQAELFVPHFVQGGGFNTQFILLGSSNLSQSNGIIRFLTQSGQAMTLPIQ